jgi:uncharacterized membrane protein
MSDLMSILYWNFFFFIFGLSVWPLVWKYFPSFWDRGYGLSKALGLAFIGWAVWTGGVLRLLPFNVVPMWAVIISIWAISWGYISRISRDQFIDWHKRNLKIVIFYELLFLISFSFWAVIRGFQPDIEGLEKFMDFGFMNSVVRSEFFPPLDMWWAGEHINYYYFGHYLAGMVTKLSGIDSSVTYNLAIAHLFGLGVIGAFSVGSNLVWDINKKYFWIAGLLCAFLLNLGGNWHTIYAFFESYNVDQPVPFWQLKPGWSPDTYWYPNATRFIPFTIHEFPIYSYVVADLHGHVSDIPFVILFIGMLLSYTKTIEQAKSQRKLYLEAFSLIPFGLLLSVILMTNYWDLPIYGLAFGVTTFLTLSRKNRFFDAVSQTIWKGILVLVIALIGASGFLLNFEQIAEGVQLVNARSKLFQLAILYGWPIFMTLGYFICVYFIKKSKGRFNLLDTVSLGIIGVAWFLIVIPEIVYVKDIYIAEYHRANTMFKLVYQSFVLFSLVSPYIIFRTISLRKEWKDYIWYAWLSGVMIGVSLLAIYPFLAIKSYYGNLRTYKGLYGMHFLDNSVGDLAAIYWLKKNISGQPVILEAPGDSYTLYNRVSAMTGIPTVVGWAVHEWLWRGGYDQVGVRIAEVENIYTGENDDERMQYLIKYGVQYVLIGEKEREKYGDRLKEELFLARGNKIFEYAGVALYEMK